MSSPARRLARAVELGILVDEQDEWLLSECMWVTGHSGHIRAYRRGYAVFIHNCIIGMPIDRNYVVHHKDMNPLNNRRSNLIYVTVRANNMLRKRRPEWEVAIIEANLHKY